MFFDSKEVRHIGVWIRGLSLAAALFLNAPEPVRACVGDCNSNNQVAINEVIIGVNIGVGTELLEVCPAFDSTGDGFVRVNEVILAVNNGLRGCPATPTPKGTPTHTLPPPPTVTRTPVPRPLVFSLRWEGPADLDLWIITPGGREVGYFNADADGCFFDYDQGGDFGPLEETITCPNPIGGTYQAFADNLEVYSVETNLEITFDGDRLELKSPRIGAEGTAGPYRVEVESGIEPTPPPGNVEVWREDNARLRSSNCSDELDDLLGDYLPFVGAELFVERDGNQVTVSDPAETSVATGTARGSVIDVNLYLSDSGGGCSVSVDVNLTADVGRSPTTATYTADWSFSGCPGFFDCRQTVEGRWTRQQTRNAARLAEAGQRLLFAQVFEAVLARGAR